MEICPDFNGWLDEPAPGGGHRQENRILKDQSKGRRPRLNNDQRRRLAVLGKALDCAVKKIPPRSPNCNAYMERFMRSIKDECLNRMIFFSEKSLAHAVEQYLAYYHGERNHQGLESRIIAPAPEVGRREGEVIRRDRLGGILRYYYREAG